MKWMFFRYLWKKKRFVILYIILAVIAAGSMAVFNLYITPLFDDAEVGNFESVIRRLGLMFVWYIAIRLMDYYTELTGIHTVNLVRREIKHDLFDAVIHKQIPDHAQHNVGEYISEFTNDITVIENKFLLPCKETISYLITIVTACAAISTIDFRMTFVIAVGTFMCLGLPVMMTKYTSGRMMRFINRFDLFVQHLKDVFTAFFTFKNYAVEEKIITNFSDENAEVEKVKFNAEFSLVVMNNLVGRLAWLIELLVVVIGLLGVIYGNLSIGSVFSAYMLAGNLGIPLQSLGNRISMIRSVKGIEEKFNVLGTLQKKITPNKHVAQEIGAFDIKLENVSLELKGNRILDNISLSFEHGKKYLILGGNGSGKSTTAKILKNTYCNYRGRVALGDFDLQSSEGVGLTRCISYSNETVSLISDSVRNNILLYREVSEERLEDAVKLAELHVPMDRMIGDGGRFLSSGERRKLEIARALIDNPQIMILDEVVSTLDIETAYEIEKLVLSLEGRTVIMISNAFSGQLLEQYDQIIMMGEGRVLASGTHNEMLQRSAEYREVYRIRCAKI